MMKVSNNGPRKWSASNKCLYERKPVVNQLWPPKWWQHFTIRVFMSKIECLRCRGSFLSFHLKQTGIVPTQCRGQAWRMITTDKWDSTFWLTSWISAEELLLLEVGIKTTLGVVLQDNVVYYKKYKCVTCATLKENNNNSNKNQTLLTMYPNSILDILACMMDQTPQRKCDANAYLQLKKTNKQTENPVICWSAVSCSNWSSALL